MSKFKVGDKVRVKKSNNPTGIMMGSIYQLPNMVPLPGISFGIEGDVGTVMAIGDMLISVVTDSGKLLNVSEYLVEILETP